MKVSPVPVERGFYVRLMSPLGRYPAQSLFSESAALIISPDVCFSIIKVLREDWSFSEVDSLKALEIPLYGSVLLSGQTGTPYLYPYPASNLVTLESEGAQSIEQCVSECRTLLL